MYNSLLPFQVKLSDSWSWNCAIGNKNIASLRRGEGGGGFRVDLGRGGGDTGGKLSREMRDVAVAGEDCVRVLGPGPEVRAYEEG